MEIELFKQAFSLGMIFLFGSTGETITEKSGHLNLGIPGIMCIGGIGGCMGANWALGLDPFLVVISAIFFAMFFAGLAGGLYGLFTITMRCNQNVTGLALTTFGVGLLGFWGSIMGNKHITFNRVSKIFTEPLFGEVGSDWFSQIFLSHGVLVYVALIIALITAFILKRTRVGLNLNAIGENPAAADAAGINVTKYKYISCTLGGAISGIGGAFYLLDCTRGSLEYVIDTFGWLAVALVIFSLWRPGLGIIGSFIFGILYLLPNYSYNMTFAQKELMMMVPYVVTAVTLIIISFFNKKETQPPASLGVPYFREDR